MDLLVAQGAYLTLQVKDFKYSSYAGYAFVEGCLEGEGKVVKLKIYRYGNEDVKIYHTSHRRYLKITDVYLSNNTVVIEYRRPKGKDYSYVRLEVPVLKERFLKLGKRTL